MDKHLKIFKNFELRSEMDTLDKMIKVQSNGKFKIVCEGPQKGPPKFPLQSHTVLPSASAEDICHAGMF